MLPRYERGSNWEDELAEALAGTLAGLAILAAIVLVVATVTLVIVVMKEIVRVYMTRVSDARYGKLLWGALAVFLGLLLVAGLLAATPAASAGLAIASWAFLAFIIAVEAVDVLAGGPATGEPDWPAEPAIDDVLVPWELDAPQDAA